MIYREENNIDIYGPSLSVMPCTENFLLVIKTYEAARDRDDEDIDIIYKNIEMMDINNYYDSPMAMNLPEKRRLLNQNYFSRNSCKYETVYYNHHYENASIINEKEKRLWHQNYFYDDGIDRTVYDNHHYTELAMMAGEEMNHGKFEGLGAKNLNNCTDQFYECNGDSTLVGHFYNDTKSSSSESLTTISSWSSDNGTYFEMSPILERRSVIATSNEKHDNTFGRFNSIKNMIKKKTVMENNGIKVAKYKQSNPYDNTNTEYDYLDEYYDISSLAYLSNMYPQSSDYPLYSTNHTLRDVGYESLNSISDSELSIKSRKSSSCSYVLYDVSNEQSLQKNKARANYDPLRIVDMRTTEELIGDSLRYGVDYDTISETSSFSCKKLCPVNCAFCSYDDTPNITIIQHIKDLKENLPEFYNPTAVKKRRHVPQTTKSVNPYGNIEKLSRGNLVRGECTQFYYQDELPKNIVAKVEVLMRNNENHQMSIIERVPDSPQITYPNLLFRMNESFFQKDMKAITCVTLLCKGLFDETNKQKRIDSFRSPSVPVNNFENEYLNVKTPGKVQRKLLKNYTSQDESFGPSKVVKTKLPSSLKSKKGLRKLNIPQNINGTTKNYNSPMTLPACQLTPHSIVQHLHDVTVSQANNLSKKEINTCREQGFLPATCLNNYNQDTTTIYNQESHTNASSCNNIENINSYKVNNFTGENVRTLDVKDTLDSFRIIDDDEFFYERILPQKSTQVCIENDNLDNLNNAQSYQGNEQCKQANVKVEAISENVSRSNDSFELSNEITKNKKQTCVVKNEKENDARKNSKNREEINRKNKELRIVINAFGKEKEQDEKLTNDIDKKKIYRDIGYDGKTKCIISKDKKSICILTTNKNVSRLCNELGLPKCKLLPVKENNKDTNNVVDDNKEQNRCDNKDNSSNKNRIMACFEAGGSTYAVQKPDAASYNYAISMTIDTVDNAIEQKQVVNDNEHAEIEYETISNIFDSVQEDIEYIAFNELWKQKENECLENNAIEEEKNEKSTPRVDSDSPVSKSSRESCEFWINALKNSSIYDIKEEDLLFDIVSDNITPPQKSKKTNERPSSVYELWTVTEKLSEIKIEDIPIDDEDVRNPCVLDDDISHIDSMMKEVEEVTEKLRKEFGTGLNDVLTSTSAEVTDTENNDGELLSASIQSNLIDKLFDLNDDVLSLDLSSSNNKINSVPTSMSPIVKRRSRKDVNKELAKIDKKVHRMSMELDSLLVGPIEQYDFVSSYGLVTASHDGIHMYNGKNRSKERIISDESDSCSSDNTLADISEIEESSERKSCKSTSSNSGYSKGTVDSNGSTNNKGAQRKSPSKRETMNCRCQQFYTKQQSKKTSSCHSKSFNVIERQNNTVQEQNNVSSSASEDEKIIDDVVFFPTKKRQESVSSLVSQNVGCRRNSEKSASRVIDTCKCVKSHPKSSADISTSSSKESDNNSCLSCSEQKSNKSDWSQNTLRKHMGQYDYSHSNSVCSRKRVRCVKRQNSRCSSSQKKSKSSTNKKCNTADCQTCESSSAITSLSSANTQCCICRQESVKNECTRGRSWDCEGSIRHGSSCNCDHDKTLKQNLSHRLSVLLPEYECIDPSSLTVEKWLSTRGR